MSAWEADFHEPESCICPMCRQLMRLSRVPALKALATTEFYFKCDSCDYTSLQVTTICSDLVCSIHQGADLKPATLDVFAWCERQIAGLMQASGART